jgi:hypothetical protein
MGDRADLKVEDLLSLNCGDSSSIASSGCPFPLHQQGLCGICPLTDGGVLALGLSTEGGG